MKRTLSFILVCACAGPSRHDVATPFLAMNEPDRAELSAAARAMAAKPESPDAHIAFVSRCLRAGVEATCRQVYERHAPQSAGIAFLALAFGDTAVVEQRLAASADAADVRFVLASTLARHYAAHAQLEQAEAALQTADSIAQAAQRESDRALTHIAVDIERRHFTQALAELQALVEGPLLLTTEQRELAIRLGSRLSERAATGDEAATDAARRVLSMLSRQSADESTADAESAAKKYPDSGLVWTALGLARMKAGDEIGAVLALERARELCAFDPEPDWQLAKLHERRQRYARAVFHLRRALESAPTYATALWRLGDLSLMARDLGSAELAMRRLKRLYPDELRVDLGRARVLLEGDDALRALAVLKEAARHYPTDVRAPLALAKAALTLRERATTTTQKREMFGEAQRAYGLAKDIDEAHGEVQALEKALGDLRGAP